jgi:putative ABC transport system permease protein
VHFLENYPERISRYSWVFLVSTLLMLAIAFLSVLWQTLKAARTNPAVELKKE